MENLYSVELTMGLVVATQYYIIQAVLRAWVPKLVPIMLEMVLFYFQAIAHYSPDQCLLFLITCLLILL